MLNKVVFIIVGIVILLSSCDTTAKVANSVSSVVEEVDSIHYAKEKHFANVRQVTFNGDNAEAYWSFDNEQLIFQAKNEKWGTQCDQIYLMDKDWTQEEGKIPPMMSTGNGRTTCSYFLPGNDRIIYSSTHSGGEDCPIAPPRVIGGKYVWPIYRSYELYVADTQGNILDQLTNSDGYDAEATVSPLGDKIVFTSVRNGDLDLFTMNIDGSDVRQITHDLGYDGGGFFSPDGSKIVFRANRPSTEDEIKAYKYFLSQDLIQPTAMEIYVCNADGSDLRQITNLGGANWAPYWHPSGEKIIFASNHTSGPAGFPFNMFMINLDGTGLEQISYGKKFDSFPMFSHDGKKIAFSSNRNNGGTRSTNIFIADWVE